MELESDSLRRQLQQIAHNQRARANEHRLQQELELRKVEWSNTVSKYMAAVRMLDHLQGLAMQSLRNENLIACLEAAQIEIDRVRSHFGRVVETLGSLNGININNESIEAVRRNTHGLSHLADTLEEVISQSNQINQGKTVRQFVQQLSAMAHNLGVAESNAKYESIKTINVSSDVLFAKLIKENPPLDNSLCDV